MAQAIIQFLEVQAVARDGKEQSFFGGCVGILRDAQWQGLALPPLPGKEYLEEGHGFSRAISSILMRASAPEGVFLGAHKKI